MANEIASKWYYPFTKVSQDKRVALPAVPSGFAAELSGFDGQLYGGLRPFSGFTKVHDLDCLTGAVADSPADLFHTKNSQVTDFFPLTFNIDFDTYGYGFVYRMQRPNNKAFTTWTFSSAAAENSTIKLISSDGTTKIYKAITSGSNGTSTAAVAGSATFTFSGAGIVGGTIRLISTDGTTKTYVGSNDSSAANGEVSSSGAIIYKVGSSASDSATNLKAAIDHANGHNAGSAGSKIVVTLSTGQVNLTQAVTGTAGNTAITVSSSPDFNSSCSVNPPSAFTLGEEQTIAFVRGGSGADSAAAIKLAIDHANGHTSSRFTVVVDTAKVTVTQVTEGTAGNTAVTSSTTFNDSCSVNPGLPDNKFKGGSSTSEADIFLDFYLAECGVWSQGNLIKSNISSTEPMDVESCGRMVFVGIRGSSPILFYVTDSPVGLDETSTSHDLVCPQGAFCTSSSDGSHYCPATASLTFNDTDQAAYLSNIAAEAVFKFTSHAFDTSFIVLKSSDGLTKNYRAKHGATNGSTETVGGVPFVLFNSGKAASTAGPMTFSGAMPADETIKLIDTNRVERTYKSQASGGTDVVSTSSSSATFTFGFPAVEGSTLQLTDNEGTPVTRNYKCTTSSQSFENGETDGTFIYFNAGSSVDNSRDNLIEAINNSETTIGITASAGGTGVVNLSQDTAGDGNTLISTSGSFNSSTTVDPPVSFTGGGKIIKFTKGSSAADSAAGLNAALIHANGHNGSITTGYSSGASLTFTQTVFDGNNGNTTITVSGSWNANCSVNAPAAFTNASTDDAQATSAATNLKAAIDSTEGHNATQGFASTDFTFTGAATVGGTLQLESNIGTNKTLTYKGATNGSVTNGDLDGSAVQFNVGTDAESAANNFIAAMNSANGHNALSANASISFSIWDTPDNGNFITIESTDGTSKKYIFSHSGLTGDLDGSGNTIVRLKADGSSTFQEAAELLLAAIDNTTNGHGTKISTSGQVIRATDSTPSSYKVTLTQSVAGEDGNKNIVFSPGMAARLIAGYPTAFSGGTADWDGIVTNSGQRFTVEANSGVVGKVFIEQLESGTGGNTTITDGSSFDGAVSGSTDAAFSGGSASTSASTNLRLTVTANSSGTAGQVNLVQSVTGVSGNTVIVTGNGFNSVCNPDVPTSFTGGGTFADGASFTLINTNGASFVYKFDRSSTDVSGSTDADGRFIIGISGRTSLVEQVEACILSIQASADSTQITAFTSGPSVAGLQQVVGGTAGNTAVVLDTEAAKIITKTDFAGGVGPDAVASETSVASQSCLVRHSLVIEETPGPGPKPLLDGPKMGWDFAYKVDVPSDTNVSSNSRLILSTQKPNSGIYKNAGEPLYDGGFNTTGAVYYGGTSQEIVDTWNAANPDNIIDCDFDYGGPQDPPPDADTTSDTTSNDDPNCTMDMSVAVPYIGVVPGARPNPTTPQNSRKNICIFKLNTIPAGNSINQLPILEIYSYFPSTGHSNPTPIEELQMEVYIRKKDDPNNPAPADSTDGYGTFQPVAAGIHLKNITTKRDEMYTFIENSKGGMFAQYSGDTGRNTTVAVEEQQSFATAAGYENHTCYVTYVNLAQYFQCDNWSPGEYQTKATIRTMCCDPNLNQSSSTGEFKVDSVVCNFESSASATASQVKDVKMLDKGNYIFAYLLYDSKTGRRSGLTKVLSVKKEDFTAEKNFAFVDIVYDKTQYDHAYFYRSVNTMEAGGVAVAGILSLDRIAKLEDFITEAAQPTSNTNYKRAIYPYQLEDLSLLYQPTYKTESPIFDESMPFGGTLLWYGNTLLVSRIKNSPSGSSSEQQTEDIQRGIGELRWSSMMESSPEMFSPYNRFVPVVPSNEIIALKTLGDMVYGFSRDRAYNIRKDTGLGMGFMRIMDLHEGFGTTGANSLEGVGSSMYYMTPKGIKALNAKGQLDDVRAFDHHIATYWPRDLTNVQMAYDPTGSCLFVLHPDMEQTLCLWFNTGRSTLLEDVTFTSCKDGPWPNRTAVLGDDLVDRALFLQNPPTDSGSQGFLPRVYVHDYKYERTISGSGTSAFNGKKRITMLEGQGDTRFNTEGVVSSKVMTIDNADGSKVSNAWVGGYVYVIDSSTNSYVGKKSKILSIGNPDIDEIAAGSTSASEATLTLADTTLDDLPAGSRVCVSPVYMRWVGHNIGMNSEAGTQYGTSDDYHTVKHMDSLSVMFTDVTGPPSTDSSIDNRYAGLAFKGSNLTPVDVVYPTDLNDSKTSSITDGESIHSVAYGDGTDSDLLGSYGVKGPSIAPGLEVICPDLDFLLLSGIVMGKVLPTTRNSRPSVGT